MSDDKPKPEFYEGGAMRGPAPVDPAPLNLTDKAKDHIIVTQGREIEIRGQQIKHFQEENDRFREMVDTTNKNCRALQVEVGMVNARAMEVTAALILKNHALILGNNSGMDGDSTAVHITREALRHASSGFMLEKVKPGDPDYLDSKQEGDLLLRLRKTTQEERDNILREMAKVEKAEAERATPETPSEG